jgi:uncharacterized protein YkwD
VPAITLLLSLILAPWLMPAACLRAHEASILFDHTRPDGREWFTVITDHPYLGGTYQELLARRPGSPIALDNLIDGWENSHDHAEVLFGPATEIAACQVDGYVAMIVRRE